MRCHDRPDHRRGYPGQRGFSLIELMVAMLVGTLLTLAVTTLLANAEARRRTLVSVDDMEQIGSYAMYQLDKFVRSAGSGFASSYALSYGCMLGAVKSGNVLMPVPATALPYPFSGSPANLNGSFRLAPVLIVHNGSANNSDALIVMSGSAGIGETPTTFGLAPSSTTLNLSTTLGFTNSDNTTAGDLLLVVDQNGAGGASPCLIEQVDNSPSFTPSATTTQVPLAGDYYTASGAGTTLNAFSALGEVMDLGNPAGGNPPLFQIIGVGAANSTATDTTTTNFALYSYDLLNINNPGAVSALADQVFEMHALYYVDSDGDGVPDTWVPADGSTSINGITYTAASLMTGTSAAATALHNIKALRIGLIIRSPLKQKEVVQAATSFSLFQDVSGGALTYTLTLTSDDQKKFRYRTLETTIPIRNSFF